jgi:hypothetical protein
MTKTLLIYRAAVQLLLVFGLALSSGRASINGETTGEYFDDSTMTSKVNAINVKEPDGHRVVRVQDQRDRMITAGWYGDAIAGSGNEQPERRYGK